jgi:hypothetical protein
MVFILIKSQRLNDILPQGTLPKGKKRLNAKKICWNVELERRSVGNSKTDA